MPDDKPSKDSSIPPPLDPFPTYQTPYPRSSNEHENPFIQFRRFADEQFSSIFQGIPQLFGFQARDADDLMRRRHELEEGWRKQFEQEMEEMRHEIEKSRTTALKAMEDAWSRSTEEASKIANHTEQGPWWTKGKAAKCPALNGQEPQRNAKKCPALYDEAGQAKTELELYEGYDTRQAEEASGHTAGKDVSNQNGGPWFDWLTPGDLKSKERARKADTGVSVDTPYIAIPGTPYSRPAVRHFQPFDNPDHTIPWLMLSQYSPIYLCNPKQPRLFRVRIQDDAETPLQISRPKFTGRLYSDVDEKLAQQLPWADAFEDLVSLQLTGRMVDRNYSTLRTPSTWIHDMVGRGSLGDRWGLNDDGLLVKRMNASQVIESGPTMKDRCRWRKERGWGPWRRFEEAEKSATPKDDEKMEDSIDKLIDSIPESITQSPVFGGLLSAADSIISAVEQSVEDALRQNEEQTTETTTKSLETDTTAPAKAEEPDSTPYTSLASSSSSSSSSYSYESNTSSSYSSSLDQEEPRSIISTVTSTVTRSLPDGSIETKRVFKRRFADGSEESDESTEVKNAPSPRSASKIGDVNEQGAPETTRQLGVDNNVPIVANGQQDMERIRRTYGQAFENDQNKKEDIQAPPPPQPQKTQPIAEQAAPQPPQARRGSGWFWSR